MTEENKTHQTAEEAVPEDTAQQEVPKQTAEPYDGAAKAHQSGEEIGRAITGVVVTGGSFVVGLAKGLGKPIIDKITEVSKNSQGSDIGDQANEAFNNGVKTAESWVGKKDDDTQ